MHLQARLDAIHWPDDRDNSDQARTTRQVVVLAWRLQSGRRPSQMEVEAAREAVERYVDVWPYRTALNSVLNAIDWSEDGRSGGWDAIG